jgi:transcriptional regulator with AAA-type ATPase domain
MIRDPSITISSAGEDGSETPDGRTLTRLILALECRNPRSPATRFALHELSEVEIGRGQTRFWQRTGSRLEVQVRDFEVSRQHARLKRHADGWELIDLGSKNGTYVNGTPVTSTMLVDGDLIETGGAMFIYRDDGNASLPDGDLDLAATSLPPALRTVNIELESLVGTLTKTAPSTIPILIRGETGTGKELIARAIHDLSGRRGAFVPVNCGALPRTLVESELFGSKRGAFSGAQVDRDGLVRRADGGTLFLDEIAELPEESQVALLRVLQEGEVRPVGASDAIRVDLRVIAATHQDLEARIMEGRFRRDLYARLIGYVITLPALRARREDVGTLIGTILSRIVDESIGVTLHRQAARALMGYDYPLNIRELEQAIRAAVALSDNREIRLEHLPEVIRTYTPGEPDVPAGEQQLSEQITELLRLHKGNVTAVARKLGKAPVQIRRWCRRYNIQIASFRR